MYWLAQASDRQRAVALRRFDARFWTVNFPRPMMAAVTAPAIDRLEGSFVFYRKNDLAGLIWESADHYDHPLLGYDADRDYGGVTLQFRWQSSNVKALDAVNGPTLTIEGRDASGAAKSWYVRLSNYAAGAPHDAVITLDFDHLDGGFLLPSEADPVYPRDIDRLFISVVPDEYDGVAAGPLGSAPGVYASRDATVILSGIKVTGGRAAVGLGDGHVKPHTVRLANGYDDVYNVTPERVARNALHLGYRGVCDFYLGMSHFMSLSWSPGEGRYVVDAAKPALNFAAAAWLAAFFAAARTFRFTPVLSLSFEILQDYIPLAWRQMSWDGQPATTGWSPPSSLIAPTNGAALDWLKNAYLAAAALQAAAGGAVIAQIGEPWWWAQLDANRTPCLYDAATMALYTAETGRAMPAKHHALSETPDAGQSLYLAWLAGKLGGAAIWLRDQIKAAYPGASVGILIYTPQIYAPGAVMAPTLNLPAAWAAPAFDFIQIEDYDHVIAGDWDAHDRDMKSVAAVYGYAAGKTQYFSGFLRDPAPDVWANVDRGLRDARARGWAEPYVWAYPQILRDGAVFGDEMEEDMSGFHEVQFPPNISFGSDGGPRFSTQVIEVASGAEQRNINWAESRGVYNAAPGVKSEHDLHDLIGFFRARMGQAYGFRFKDWSDYKSCSPETNVTAFDQQIGIGNGAAVLFQLVKLYASGGAAHSRTIAKPVAGTVKIAVNGAVLASGWSVDTATGRVTFASAPANGAVITAGYEFDVPARFGADQLQTALETFRAGSAGPIPVLEIRV